ncbi:hypothetical protein ZWY2020_035234 [Hordeum vulgare]|nr:hypothetical protein ZWY2020_035234 [Hordeum vulgare]
MASTTLRAMRGDLDEEADLTDSSLECGDGDECGGSIVPIDGTQRNRASPQAICKLYKHINEDQHAAIREMGTGPFLDIKCGYLHNTIVTWFTRLYQRGRRGFVVHRRGFIPLTEESVHKILGIPRGDIDVKYEADYDNEDEIVSCLFPGDSSRPKITTVASKIMNNNNADATFKKLWLIYIVSTVLAPTTDTRISNKCYPILLRYLDALDCDGMELELPDTPHTVNAWSKTQIDVVAEMDMLEHDPPSFGNFQDEMDVDLAKELDDYESHLVDFFKQKRAAEATATTTRSNDMAGDAGVQSVTPKPNPHKGRVKKSSRFQLSPYDDEIKVSNEEEDVYAKLMLSSKFKRNGNSMIKNVIIIKYEKSWVYTWDLADSSYITGELSANCAEVGIEYLLETNKVEGKLILSRFVAKFLLQGEHAKKIVTNIFERKKDFALSCQNLIMFPVIEEIGVNVVSGNH